MSRAPVLSDAVWAWIEPLLPPQKGPMGPPVRPHRPIAEGVLFRLRTGIRWQDLPAEYGSWQTAHRRHQQWSEDSTWARVLAALPADADAAGEIDWRCSVDSPIARVHQHGAPAARSSSTVSSHTRGRRRMTRIQGAHGRTGRSRHGRSRGGLTTKTHALVDGRGRPLTLIVTPGQAGDSPVLPKLLAQLRVARRDPGRPRTRPQALRGAKAYSSRDHRAMLRSRGIIAVLPERADQIGHRKNRGSRGGRPIIDDVEDYKNHNVVERFFNQMKHWRALASRYDKKALIYRGGVVLAAILSWLS